MSRTRYIISVGQSIITNYLKRTKMDYPEFKKFNFKNIYKGILPSELQQLKRDIYEDLKEIKNNSPKSVYLQKNSAEINTFLSISPQPDLIQSEIFLITSHSVEGYFAGMVIKKILQEIEGYKNVVVEYVEHLSMDDINMFKNVGIINLIKKITKLVQDAKTNKYNVIINATGSYKPVSAFFIFTGMLLETPVHYGHEQGELLELPVIPMQYKTTLWNSCNIALLNNLYEKGSIDRKLWYKLSKQARYNIEYIIEDKGENNVSLSYAGKLILSVYFGTKKMLWWRKCLLDLYWKKIFLVIFTLL